MSKYCNHCMAELEETVVKCPICGKDNTGTVPVHHLRPGTILNGKFYVGEALGEGGFGITYIGRDTKLDMKIAIKEFYPNGYVNRSNTISPYVNDSVTEGRRDFFEKGRERFLEEARILAKFVGEPGVVDVRDFFEENNTAYIIMEYLDGMDLKTYLKSNGTLTPEHTIQLLMPVMDSLKKVHAQGLIHRDISPDNIMIIGDKVKLLDFGAARTVSAAANKSLSIMLKPGYAPEEQYRSKGAQGPWTDIYALCATMYKCITGITPDDATQRVFSDEVKMPSALNIAIKPEIEKAIMRGISVNQVDRYQCIEDLIKGLQGIDVVVSGSDKTVALGRTVSDDDAETVYLQQETDEKTVMSDDVETVYLQQETDKKTVMGNDRTVLSEEASTPIISPNGFEAAKEVKQPVVEPQKASAENNKGKNKKGIIAIVAVIAIGIIAVFVVLLVLKRGDEGGSTKKSETNVNDSNNDGTIPNENQTIDTPNKTELAKFDFTYKGKNEVITANSIKADELLNVDDVYGAIEYIPEMFYGSYKVADEAMGKYREDMAYMEYEDNGVVRKITQLPYQIEAGLDNLNHVVAHIPNHNWMKLAFESEEGYLINVYASYTVSGRTITLVPLKQYSYDADKQKVSYALGEESWTYNFSFKGSSLTLSQNGKSVTMKTRYYGDNEYGYLAEGYETVDGIDYIRVMSDDGRLMLISHSSGTETYIEDSVGGLNEDGLFAISWVHSSGIKFMRQFVFFDCGFEGFILADKNQTYYFTRKRQQKYLVDNITIEDLSELDSLSERELEEIIEKKANLLTDLAAAYKTAGLNVQIDETKGEISLDSTILFAVNESRVSDAGKEFLKKFIDIYSKVVFDEKYKDFVSKTLIEGHTDTSGTYEWNLQLSQDRAENVREYCISQESGLDVSYIDALETSVSAVGYAWDKPVYGANGKVDMDASRRVSFRFLIAIK